MNNRLLPPPTSHDIEAALTAIRDGTSPYGRWVRLDDHFLEAEADRLWWVDIIDPDGVAQDSCGGGITSAEAAAVAWINTCLLAWWLQPGASDEDYAKVPRHVPDGYRFELYAEPTHRPALKVIEGHETI